MAKFQFTELILQMNEIITARLGAAATAAGNLTDYEQNKIVKLAGDSQYNLCAAGNEIEGFINSIQGATLDGWTIGSVQVGGRKEVLCDGAQATVGSAGALSVGQYVVTGTVVAKGTDLTTAPKVASATTQATIKNGPFAWRVVSLGSAGTGAIGTTAIIEKA